MESIKFELPKGNPLKLVSYLKKYKKQFWIQTVGGVLYNTVIVAGPILLGKAIDAASQIYTYGVSRERVRNLAFICICFVLVTIFFQYARYVKRWYIRNMSNRIANDMRAGLISKTLSLRMEQIDMESVGDLMSRTVGDVDQIVSTVQSTINEAWDTWLLMISYFTVLLFYNPSITLICSIPIPFAVITAQAVRHPLYRNSLESRKAASLINSHLQKMLNGIITLRLFGREEVENERLKEFSKNQMTWNIKTNLLQTGMMPVYSTMASLGVIGVIGLGGKQVIDGSWSIGHFTSYLSMFTAMSTRTWVAARIFNQFHTASAAWDRIKEKLKDREVIYNADTSFNNASFGESYINVRNLSFQYPTSKHTVLQDINFTINKGSFVGVTGPVGSGKSSLAAVLTGLYSYEGSIMIEGRELKALSNEERVGLVAYSGQDSFLFSASIAENVAFHPVEKGSRDYVKLNSILHTTALAEDLVLFSEGINTMVGEKGTRVSGGQRQRIALSRALYTENPILILDDPFSAVDIDTEARMIERLKTDFKGSTIFLFSHRLGAFKEAD
ncbi:MAG TPA: ABC transporter ATP-binding protein, partial [Mobilitalea sp.]|nr:ABC transporter ATP-binding protein [Mobilitalea sp.]